VPWVPFSLTQPFSTFGIIQSLNCAPKRVFPAPLALVLARFSSPIFLIKRRLKTLALCSVSETSSAQGWGLSQGKPS